MALKRKFDDDDSMAFEEDPTMFRNVKQLKLVPFPNATQDEDAAMSDAPLYPDQIHTRFHSNASTNSASSGFSSASSSPLNAYPAFELYPSPTQDGMATTTAPATAASNVGLIQPKSGFAHHGTGCTTIPRLRVACSTSLHGERRSMYTLCESCGSISMVECD
ncbi:hypothetical protein DL96DRAFT_1603616 [Flagelloscypha sp. PMI_526]|nr:hypothetical protein DL96DRAFT_1603616 [Flagelloscypha sp. PMI_526]